MQGSHLCAGRRLRQLAACTRLSPCSSRGQVRQAHTFSLHAQGSACSAPLVLEHADLQRVVRMWLLAAVCCADLAGLVQEKRDCRFNEQVAVEARMTAIGDKIQQLGLPDFVCLQARSAG